MLKNIKALELIKSLKNRGHQRIRVEFAGLNALILKGFITLDNGLWTFVNSEDVWEWEIPVEADSLESLIQKLSDIGWTSFHVTETIEAMSEDDLVCNCGNTADGDGFYPCDGKGNEVVPVPNYGDLAVCARCGLIFSYQTYDPIAHTYTIVGAGEYVPLKEFVLGNGVGYLKGHFDSGECLIENTREQISAFIMDSSGESEIIITDMMDKHQITTSLGLIFKCVNQAFLPELIEILAPQQMGEVEVIPFVPFHHCIQ